MSDRHLDPGEPEKAWKPLRFFNIYRASMAGLFVVLGLVGVVPRAIGQYDAALFKSTAALYLVFAVLGILGSHWRRPGFETQVFTQVFVDIVAITDGPLSPLAALTETWCELEVPGIGPFDSSVPAVVVAELLVARVASELRDEARERIDRTEARWESMGTFE